MCWFVIDACMIFVNLNVEKWTLPSGNLSSVNLIFLSKEFKRSCITLTSFSY